QAVVGLGAVAWCRRARNSYSQAWRRRQTAHYFFDYHKGGENADIRKAHAALCQKPRKKNSLAANVSIGYLGPSWPRGGATHAQPHRLNWREAMTIPIRRAGVIGAGVMGSGIAAHF